PSARVANAAVPRQLVAAPQSEDHAARLEEDDVGIIRRSNAAGRALPAKGPRQPPDVDDAAERPDSPPNGMSLLQVELVPFGVEHVHEVLVLLLLESPDERRAKSDQARSLRVDPP